MSRSLSCSAPVYLFVYGSLKRGNRNRAARRFHVRAEYAGEASIRAKLVPFGPYLGALRGERRICGELFRLRAGTLRWLNDYEAPHYKLRRVTAVAKDGQKRRVWSYFLHMDSRDATL